MQDSGPITPTHYQNNAQFGYVEEQKPTYETKSHRKLIIFGGISLTICLVVAGFVVQFSNIVRDENGRTISDIENEISAIETEVEPLQNEQLETFRNEGFSETYYAKAEIITQKVDKQIELSVARDALSEVQKETNPLKNGSAYFFIGAFFMLMITLIIARVRR
ncbi:hypothetical protein J6X15_00455 [Candidatus Saccharibacteria bacterium]|nr:hypothetical protein [Candidatus Saccharibacteria bacterium]